MEIQTLGFHPYVRALGQLHLLQPGSGKTFCGSVALSVNALNMRSQICRSLGC